VLQLVVWTTSASNKRKCPGNATLSAKTVSGAAQCAMKMSRVGRREEANLSSPVRGIATECV
jgi:hypothetical protein